MTARRGVLLWIAVLTLLASGLGITGLLLYLQSKGEHIEISWGDPR